MTKPRIVSDRFKEVVSRIENQPTDNKLKNLEPPTKDVKTPQ